MTFGWRKELEDFSRVRHLERAFDPRLFKVASDSKPLVDPETWMKVDDQGSESSCVGHGGTASAEILNHHATGSIVSLSRMYAYLTAQAKSGLLGSDNGATISGAIEAFADTGFCKEEIFPYTGTYSTDIPEAARKAGPKCLLKSYTPQFEDIDEAKAYCRSKFGVLLIGVEIPQAFMNCSGRVSLSHVRGRSVGGHCMSLVWLGDKWRLMNSWLTWGRKGFADVDEAAVEYWMQQAGAEIRGMSDIDRLDDVPPGRLDYTGAFG